MLDRYIMITRSRVTNIILRNHLKNDWLRYFIAGRDWCHIKLIFIAES